MEKFFVQPKSITAMTSSQDEGVYTKTRAYNFLKNLVGIRPKDPLNKRVFNLCFRETEHVFLPKKKEDEITTIFNRVGVRERNEQYWNLKTQQQDVQKASQVFNETIILLEEEFRKKAA